MFTIVLLNVELDALLTKTGKVLYIPEAHTPPQAILSGFWPLFLFHPFPPTLSVRQLAPEWNLDMTVICQGLLLATHLLNLSALQLGFRRTVYSKKGVLRFFSCLKDASFLTF